MISQTMRERTNEARLILKEIKTLSDFLRNYAKGTKKGTKQFVLRPSFDFAVLLTPGSLRFPMGMSSLARLFCFCVPFRRLEQKCCNMPFLL